MAITSDGLLMVRRGDCLVVGDLSFRVVDANSEPFLPTAIIEGGEDAGPFTSMRTVKLSTWNTAIKFCPFATPTPSFRNKQ